MSYPSGFCFSSSTYLQIPPTLTSHPIVFCQNGDPEAEELVYSHYVICNDTHETLRFGQVDTDENVLLASLHSHQYSWRSHKSPQVTGAHVCTHTYVHNPGAPKYLMAHGPVVLVEGLSECTHICMLIYTQAMSAHPQLQGFTHYHQYAATICVFLSKLRDSALTALLKKIDYI